jgi:hypothetical protein
MAEANDKSTTTDWLLLRDAWLLVAALCTPAMAKRLILEYLRAGWLRWKYWQLSGDWHELDPGGRNPKFWDDSSKAVSLVIDWHESRATRSVTPGVLVTIPPDVDDDLDAAQEQRIWDEYESKKRELMQWLLKGQLPPTCQTMELIRLHRGDLEAMLRATGLVAPLAETTAEAVAAETPDMLRATGLVSPAETTAEAAPAKTQEPAKPTPTDPESEHGPQVTRALEGLRKLDITGKGRIRLRKELAEINIHVDDNAVKRALPLRKSELEGGQGGQGGDQG